MDHFTRTPHSASARVRSLCSKALAMRVISAERAPTALAVSRHVAVTTATSLMMARACGSVSAKNADAASRRSSEQRSEEHTSELQSLMRISYAVFCLKKKKDKTQK